MQDGSNSSALAMELLQLCIKRSISPQQNNAWLNPFVESLWGKIHLWNLTFYDMWFTYDQLNHKMRSQ